MGRSWRWSLGTGTRNPRRSPRRETLLLLPHRPRWLLPVLGLRRTLDKQECSSARSATPRRYGTHDMGRRRDVDPLRIGIGSGGSETTKVVVFFDGQGVKNVTAANMIWALSGLIVGAGLVWAASTRSSSRSTRAPEPEPDLDFLPGYDRFVHNGKVWYGKRNSYGSYTDFFAADGTVASASVWCALTEPDRAARRAMKEAEGRTDFLAAVAAARGPRTP